MLYSVFMMSGLSSLEKYPMVNGLYSREEDTPTIGIPGSGSARSVPPGVLGSRSVLAVSPPSAATIEKAIIIQRIIRFTGVILMESLSFKFNFF